MHRSGRMSADALLGLGLSLALGAGIAWSDEPHPTTVEELRQRVDSQQRVISRQQRALAGLEERLAQLEARVASSPRLVAASYEPAAKPVAQATASSQLPQAKDDPQQKAAPTVETRPTSPDQAVERLPELSKGIAGEFPGAFAIPGTDAALKIGGRVTYTAIHNLAPLGVDDSFVTADIPVGGETAGSSSRTSYTANPSRLNFDLRTPTGVGAMRAFVEADFKGDGNGFQLRHAFGQWQRLLVGQTWSVFSDPEADPDGLDFEGLNAISLVRQAQARWSHPLAERLDLAMSVENPKPDITGATGVSQVPDVIARLRFDPGAASRPRSGAHVQTAFVLRQLRAESEDQPDVTLSTPGYGVDVSARLRPGWWSDKDDVTFAVYAGKGIGHYIKDLSAAGGMDAVYDPVRHTLEALPVLATYLGYEHWWSPSLRSTFTWGGVWVDTLDSQPANAYRQTQRFSIDLAWSPIPRIDLMGEFLAGSRTDKDGERGTASQLQLGGRFRF